jgi:hypothetical protein
MAPIHEGLEILRDSGEMELVAGAGESAQSHAFEAMVRLEMREAHFDPLALVARSLVFRRLHKARARSRASSLTSRGILRQVTFGQHLALNEHRSESRLLAR